MAINPNPNLPEEILIDIFSRLPAKSVGKCRCLSKPWRALLSTRNFIKFHLTRQTHKQNLIFISESGDLHTISTIRDDDGTVSEKVNLSNTWSAVVGSYNGLVLLLNEEEDLYLVNPITQEQIKVPDSPLLLPKNRWLSMHGFGYDGCSDDYKIVALSYSDSVVESSFNTFVDVYSVKSGVWKRLHCSPSVVPFHCGAYVSGAIHWTECSREFGYPSAIGAFDFAHERFNEVLAPSGVVPHTVVLLDGCLCIMDMSSNSDVTDLWILKEYGKEKSWSKFRLNISYEQEITKLLCFIGDDKVAFLDDRDLLVYNFKEHDLRNKVVDGFCAGFTDGCTYTESLVSPSYGNEIEGRSAFWYVNFDVTSIVLGAKCNWCNQEVFFSGK